METVKREMFTHLPQSIQKLYEPFIGQKLINFTDEFEDGGPVVLVNCPFISDEEKKENLKRIYDVAADIMYEIEEAELKKRLAAEGM